jgi:PHD/YefM family antitoxin component YafN of YafNO toxin-antitoxin module
MNGIDPDRTLRRTVNVTEFRRHMAHYVASVRYGDDWLRIRRKGTDPVYLVSETDFRLICEKVDDLDGGPRDPKTGRRSGRGFMYWVREAFRADRKAGTVAPAPDRAAEPPPEPVRPAPSRVPEVVQRPEETATPEARLTLLAALSKAEAELEAIAAMKAAGRE